jgi:hypothetical protein
MAKVQIADVIVPSVFAPYFIDETTKLDAFIQAGVVSNGVEGLIMNRGGKLFDMPYWTDLTGDSEELSDATPLTPKKIGTSSDRARLQLRGAAWSANDLAGILAGDDPTRVFATRMAKFWVGQRQKILINSLNGIFAAATMSGNLSDISGLAGALAVIDFNKTVDAAQLLGDAKAGLQAIAMHSAVEAKLAKDQAIIYEETANKGDRIARYMDKQVIVDDDLTEGGGIYTTYLFGTGAIGYQPMPMEADKMLEFDRDILAGDDIVTSRHHFVMHPRGVKWLDATVTGGTTPSFANLALGTNWQRVFDPKKVKIVKFRHKIA